MMAMDGSQDFEELDMIDDDGCSCLEPDSPCWIAESDKSPSVYKVLHCGVSAQYLLAMMGMLDSRIITSRACRVYYTGRGV